MTFSILTTAQMVEVDRLMIEVYGIQLIQMMENAGRNLAELTRRMLGGQLSGRRIVILCGAGNNGGGGMVAARHLHNGGATVHIKLVADHYLKDIPAHQWRILTAMGLATNDDPDLAKADLILDALIGYSLSGNPRGAAAEWIERVNASKRPVLALDTPSGLDTTTGIPAASCIHAKATMTFALPKTGLVTPQAQSFVGDLYVADIGVPPELYKRMGIIVDPIFSQETIIHFNKGN